MVRAYCVNSPGWIQQIVPSHLTPALMAAQSLDVFDRDCSVVPIFRVVLHLFQYCKRFLFAWFCMTSACCLHNFVIKSYTYGILKTTGTKYCNPKINDKRVCGCFTYETCCTDYFLFFLVWHLCLDIVDVEGYCCTWSHSVTHTYIHTPPHSRQDCPGRGIGPSQRSIPDNTIYTRHSCLRLDSNPQSQQANDRRPTCRHRDRPYWLLTLQILGAA
jgi:hypothetical protein